MNAIDQLATWLSTPDPHTFPFATVIGEFHRVGKHFVPKDLLETLDGARDTLAEGSDAPHPVLARFLGTALDKFDGRYDNPSYLAVDLLPLPGTGEGRTDLHHAARQRDRLLVLLVADTLRFELAAADGSDSRLPQMRPDARITAKRCLLGVRAIRPALQRLGLCTDITTSDPVVAAREVCRTVARDLAQDEDLMLRLTILPVSVVHDEYMFIRMLQAYETTFALIGVQLSAAVAALADGDAAPAVEALAAADRAMHEARPLWSLVATVQPQAFLTFREFTEGASAIQSRSYKLVESLCRRPDQSRLDSPAYRSVPDIRERVLAGQPNLDEALRAASASGRLTSEMNAAVCCAMERFEAALLHWRQSHYRLAVKMLGRRPGTGYTEGVPYLDKVRSLRLFTPDGAVQARPAAATAAAA